jgi:hypothetical protein
MRCRILYIALSLCAALPMALRPVWAQVEPKPLFNQIFPQPTGKNGYEDLVMASDLLIFNAAIKTIQEPGATLTARRRALADPEIQRALALVRSGLDKQIDAPRTADPMSPVPLSKMMLNFFPVLRLLATEQYALLADGQTERAIQALRDALRFSYAVCSAHYRVSRSVSVEIDRVMCEQVVRHLDQLSEHDCDSLLQLVQEWLNADHSPLPELIFVRERMLAQIAQWRKDPAHSFQGWRESVSPDSQSADLVFRASLTTYIQAMDAAAALCNQQVDAAIVNLRLPPWQRQEWRSPPPDTLAGWLFAEVSYDLDKTLKLCDEDRARLQLLGVHAALRRYRWQYDRLPDNLDQLRLTSLTIDPFTGKSLSYQRKGDDYELSSAGADGYNEEGGQQPGTRSPIVLSH